MEFGLATSCKLYAGGLGILAGDTLKAAKDTGLPLVGIGIKWREGYTDQRIGPDGRPYDSFSEQTIPGVVDTGISIRVEVYGVTINCKIWKTAAFGNADLYLLDPALEDGGPYFATRRLYGGPSEDRVAQEIVLGIGGVRAIRALGLPINIFHFNEGHAAFAGFELIRERMVQGETFDTALKHVRSKVVFTTHTPIAAGNEEHEISLVMTSGAHCGLDQEKVESIGGAPFGMSVAALRLSHRANAVSVLHGETANTMWKNVKGAAPILSITNGVHRNTWVAESFRGATPTPEATWDYHQVEKNALIEFLRQRCQFDIQPGKLLVGFARRSTGYKRADLIFHDRQRAEKLFRDFDLKIVFSGKAHPKDTAGKELIARIVNFAHEFPQNVAYVQSYDMEIGAMLTRGVDVWLNNPFRPLEACGTSGMKAAMNGVLNVSTLDGWWPEVCNDGVNGWGIGSSDQSTTWEERYELDAAALYDVLEKSVIPAYYNEPERWKQMMVNSIESTRERFSADTVLRRYFSELYS